MTDPMQWLVKQNVKRLNKGAEKHSGFQTSNFSQCLEPVNSIIGKHKTSRDGICQAMSAKWIILHSQGSSLFNWIYDENGEIVRAAIANLALNQIDGETRQISATKTDQDWATDRYLFSHGILRRTGYTLTASGGGFSNPEMRIDQGTASSTTVGQRLAEAIVHAGTRVGGYVLIGIKGAGGGHCMAAYVGDDIAFFDPNFGEYWFPKRTNFTGWFNKYFWLAYRLGRIDSFYAVRSYAPKMNFVTKFGERGGRLLVGTY